MRIARLFALLLLLGAGTSAAAQGKYAHLRSWEGKHPTYNKAARKFFDLPEVRRPLKKLLDRRVYYLLTRGHTKEGPIKIIDDYLKVSVCGSPDSYACIEHVTLVMNLNDGSMYVAFDVFSPEPRYFSTKGRFEDLPPALQSWR